MTYGIIARIPQKSGSENYQYQKIHIQRHFRQGSNRPRHEQQRISGQERCHHKPRLAEYYQKKYRISPQMVGLDNVYQMLVNMQDEVNYKFHGTFSLWISPFSHWHRTRIRHSGLFSDNIELSFHRRGCLHGTRNAILPRHHRHLHRESGSGRD